MTDAADAMDAMDTADTADTTVDAGLVGIAKAIIEANVYVSIACVDEHGSPWASPVFYATDDAVDFYWMSSPHTRHRRRLADRCTAGR
jgi:hypothetical protein